MCIVRERRRERLLDPHDEGVGPCCGLGCLRVMGASGSRIVEEAGLEEASALDEAELLKGLSQGAPL